MPKQITEAVIVIELSEDPVIAEFLNHQKKGTRNTYSSYLRRLKEYCGLTGQEILTDPKLWKKKIFTFQQWLIEKGYSECYAQSACGMLRGFFGYNEKPLTFTHGDAKRLAERNRKTEDYPFDKEDIVKMAMVGDLKSRYVLLVGKSLGLRAGDFVNITYGKLRGVKLDSEPPVFIGETITEKERVKAFPFLDSDAVPIVKAILEANQDKPNSEYILMTRSKKKHNTFQRMQDAELSKILQSLARKAKIQNGSKRIRFHCMRKYLTDRLSAHMSESKWKQCVGKKIPESAYVSDVELKEAWLRAMPTIAISINGNGKLKKDLQDTQQSVETLSEIITSQKTEIDRLTKTLDAIHQEQKEYLMRKPIMEKEAYERGKMMAEQMQQLNERLSQLETKNKKKIKKT